MRPYLNWKETIQSAEGSENKEDNYRRLISRSVADGFRVREGYKERLLSRKKMEITMRIRMGMKLCKTFS